LSAAVEQVQHLFPGDGAGVALGYHGARRMSEGEAVLAEFGLLALSPSRSFHAGRCSHGGEGAGGSLDEAADIVVGGDVPFNRDGPVHGHRAELGGLLAVEASLKPSWKYWRVSRSSSG